MRVFTSPVLTPVGLFVALMALAGCDTTGPVAPPKPGTKPVLSTKECQPSRVRNCYFRNSPVTLTGDPVTLPGRPYPFFRTARALDFVDAEGREWRAPQATLTDGASIPPYLVPIVGDPTKPEFANAAAVHDAYCGIGNEEGTNYHKAPWQSVHRMFYDTLIVGGTPVPRAQLMFAAVWLGGPRWDAASGRNDRSLDVMSASIRVQAVAETRAFIAREKPDLNRLIGYLEWQENAMRWRAEAIGAPAAPP